MGPPGESGKEGATVSKKCGMFDSREVNRTPAWRSGHSICLFCGFLGSNRRIGHDFNSSILFIKMAQSASLPASWISQVP